MFMMWLPYGVINYNNIIIGGHLAMLDLLAGWAGWPRANMLSLTTKSS